MNRSAATGWTVTILVILALFLGSRIHWRPGAIVERQAERMAIENAALQERLEREMPWRVRFRVGLMMAGVGLAAVAVVVAAGVGAGLVYYTWQKAWQSANTVRPDRRGMYPLLQEKGRDGGTWIIHNPNTNLAPTTVYTSDEQGRVVVTHILSGSEPAQLATTARAQAVQALTAADRREGSLPAWLPRLTGRIIPAPDRVLDLEVGRAPGEKAEGVSDGG